MAAEHYDRSEPVNLGADSEISIKDLTESIAKLTGFEGEIRWNTDYPDGQPRRALDASRAAEEFGFRARVSLEEGLKKTIEWYQNQLTEG